MPGDARDVLQSRDSSRPAPTTPGWLRRFPRRPRLGAGLAIVTAIAVAGLGGGSSLLRGGSPAGTPTPQPTVTADRPAMAAAGPASTLLAAALLRPSDVYDHGTARRGASVRDSVSSPRLHRCDVRRGGAVAATRTLAGAAGAGVAQRVLVGLDTVAAERLYADQVQALRSCPDAYVAPPRRSTPSLSDMTVFQTVSAGGSGAAVAVIRVGAVVSQVVRHPGKGAPAEAAPIAALAARAVARLRTGLPVDTGAGPPVATAAVTRIPAGFRFGEEHGPAARTATGQTSRQRGRRTAWELGACPGTTTAVGTLPSTMLTVTRRSETTGVQVLQLALFADARTATRAWAGFRSTVMGCALGRPGSGAGTDELWTSRPLALGSQGLLAVGRYRLDGRPVSGTARAAAVRVGNAVYLRVEYRGGLPGQPDPLTGAAVRAATADVGRVCALVQSCG